MRTLSFGASAATEFGWIVDRDSVIVSRQTLGPVAGCTAILVERQLPNTFVNYSAPTSSLREDDVFRFPIVGTADNLPIPIYQGQQLYIIFSAQGVVYLQLEDIAS